MCVVSGFKRHDKMNLTLRHFVVELRALNPHCTHRQKELYRVGQTTGTTLFRGM